MSPPPILPSGHRLMAIHVRSCGADFHPIGNTEGLHTRFPLVSYFVIAANDSPMSDRDPPLHRTPRLPPNLKSISK